MAMQSLTITCPACFNDIEVLEFNTETRLSVHEDPESPRRYLQTSISAQVRHDDCSAIPA